MFLRRYNSSLRSWVACEIIRTRSGLYWYPRVIGKEYASTTLQLVSSQTDTFYSTIAGGGYGNYTLPYLSYTQDLGFTPKGYIAYNDPSEALSVSCSVGIFEDLYEVFMFDTNHNGRSETSIAHYGSSERPVTRRRIKLPVNRKNQTYTLFIVGEKE